MTNEQETATTANNVEVKEYKGKKRKTFWRMFYIFSVTFVLISVLFGSFFAGRAVAEGKVMLNFKDLSFSNKEVTEDKATSNTGEADLSTTANLSDESVNKFISKAAFYEDLKFNSLYNAYYIAGLKDNAPLSLIKTDQVKFESVNTPDQIEKLIKLRSVFDSKSAQFKTELPNSSSFVSHVGVKFNKDEKVVFVNDKLGKSEITLPEDINLEVSKILNSKDKIMFGVANSFTGNALSAGNLFVESEIDSALEKLNNATKTSVIVSDVKFWWDKTTNVIAGARYSDTYSTIAEGKVDLVDVVGLVAPEGVSLSSRGYVPGSALIGNQAVSGVWAGGVCYWATTWNTAMRMGLDTYGIDYKVINQTKHSRLDSRYAPTTVYPYVLNDKNYYDVTVAYSPDYGKVGSVTEIEEGKRLEIKTTILIANANSGRFLAVTEAKEYR